MFIDLTTILAAIADDASGNTQVGKIIFNDLFMTSLPFGQP
jgi:anaerobic C4-dicarboxylate transporter